MHRGIIIDIKAAAAVRRGKSDDAKCALRSDDGSEFVFRAVESRSRSLDCLATPVGMASCLPVSWLEATARPRRVDAQFPVLVSNEHDGLSTDR